MYRKTSLTQLWGNPTDASSKESSKNMDDSDESTDDESVDLSLKKKSVNSRSSRASWASRSHSVPHNSKKNSVVEDRSHYSSLNRSKDEVLAGWTTANCQHFIRNTQNKKRECSVTEILEHEDQDLVSQITDTNEGDNGTPYMSKGEFHTPSRVSHSFVTPQSNKRIRGQVEGTENNENCDPNPSKKISLWSSWS